MVFNGTLRPDVYSYVVMLRGLVQTECHAEVAVLHQDMRWRRPCPEAQDDFVLSLALKACIRSAEYEYGYGVHGFVLNSFWSTRT
jgi:hypothetical protein